MADYLLKKKKKQYGWLQVSEHYPGLITAHNCFYKRNIKELEAYLMLNYTYQLSWWWKCNFSTRPEGQIQSLSMN